MRLPPLLVYTVLRLLAFVVPLLIMWMFFPILREFWWLSAIFAALIGMSLSLLFLRRPLSGVSESVARLRAGRAPNVAEQDADAEDSVTDAAPGDERTQN